MATALIGSTGLVGKTLLKRATFDDLYHSPDIESIAGRSYDLVVCAGAPAQKWLANREPDADRANLRRLTDALRQVRAREFVLISTVDVFPEPMGVDEASAIDVARQQPYGRHRWELERFVADHFRHLILRLPALFGPGLKKNVIFDLLHGNQVSAIHPEAQYQFYNLDRLWDDVQTARAAALPLVHLTTEPVSMRDVAAAAFGIRLEPAPLTTPPRYDMRSQHAHLAGGRGGYWYSRGQVLDEIRRFVAEERQSLAGTRRAG